MATVGLQTFFGLSSETRPTSDPRTGDDLTVPSLFVEQDTGHAYLWGGTAWQPLAGATTLDATTLLSAYTQSVAARFDELNRLVRKLILGLELNFNNGEFPEVE